MIIVIGGGITGLSAAYELRRRELPFVLLEASDRAGGLIRTERIDGFTLDVGPDSILAQKPSAVDLCEELGLGPRLMPTRVPRTAFVLKGRRLHRLPSRSVLGIPTTVAAAMGFDLLPWHARVRVALEPLVPRGGGGDESVASFFHRRFGRAAVGLIAEPLLGGIHAGDIEQLSVVSLFPRLVEAERKRGNVIGSLRSVPPASGDGAFRALRGGMEEVVRTILARLPAGSVQLNSPVAALRASGRSWRVESPAQNHDADAVIIAAPAYAVAALLESIDGEAARICGQVPYVSTAAVVLGFKQSAIRHPLSGSGFVVARRHAAVRITACTWVSSKWESRAPDGHVLLRAFLGGTHDPGVVKLSDAALVETVIRDLTPLLGITAPPVLARAYRWIRAGAQHTVGHVARVQDLRARLRAYPGVFVAGSGFDSIGIPDCVANGRAAAAAAADYVGSGGPQRRR